MVGMYGANYDLIKMMVLFGMVIQGYIIYPELNKTFEKMGWDVQKAIDQIEKQLPDKVLKCG